MSVRLSGSMPLFSTLFSALACGASVTALLTRGVVPHVATSGIDLIPVTLAAGTFPLLLFQGVCPVVLLISPRMILESCALNVGTLSWFLMGLVWAGSAAPLPLHPLPPLPCPGHLGNMVADSLHPRVGTLWYKIVDWLIGQSSGVANM